jgi:hypothetical protein
MADDPNPTLRAQLKADLEILGPQMRGLDDLGHTSITPELRAEVVKQYNMRTQRMGLIQNVLDKLDATFAAIKALEADGYPGFPPAPISPNLFDELQGENTDYDAAVGLFTAADQATTMTVTLGAPTAKPQAAK